MFYGVANKSLELENANDAVEWNCLGERVKIVRLGGRMKPRETVKELLNLSNLYSVNIAHLHRGLDSSHSAN